ncbi:diguanylate cyclase [Sneathiella marina]|uniref:diguanylate cyclase n=1 Tax=Sneathiella marina TaxID=2950108 RepID=A0ABY4W5R6_9PROT|nr:diguanylate cyclase [Sneathiella marina]USG62533.1 diguanylate cyclase [Sneathiella marina]
MKYVLSVEDSRLFANQIKQSIEEQIDDTIVIIASSMSEAMELLRSGKYNFQLALLDLNLPDAPDGEIVDLVISHNIPIFVFSSLMEEKLHKQVFSKPVIDYVLKNNTTSISSLIKMVRRYFKNATTKLLYVDDSKTAQQFISNLLKRYNFNVLTASSGKEGLEILEKNLDISLVLTDFIMPNMDGIELTKQIRKNYPNWNLAIIGLSAGSEQNISARFLKSGGNDFINKNFHREEFFCRIHQNINLVEHMNELHHVASNDFLTGLPNRRTFFTMGETLFENAVRQDMSAIVAMMDIDFFKSVNDTWGHNIGDKVLQAVADKLSNRCRASDLLARVGGEEFAFVGIDINAAQAKQVLDDFRTAVEEVIIEENGDEIRPTISIGFTDIDFANNFGKDFNSLIQFADEALYQAKENGRNRVEKYSEQKASLISNG